MKKLKLIITTLFILTTTFLYANITVIKVEGVSAYFDSAQQPTLSNQRSATAAQRSELNVRSSTGDVINFFDGDC